MLTKEIPEEIKKHIDNVWKAGNIPNKLKDNLWYVVKAKDYTEQNILDFSKALKLIKEYLSNDKKHKEKRAEYLKFCGITKRYDNFKIPHKIANDLFFYFIFIECGLITPQKKGIKFEGLVRDFKKRKTYAEMEKIHGKKILEDKGANLRNFINFWKCWGYGYIGKDINNTFEIQPVGYLAIQDENLNEKNSLEILNSNSKNINFLLFRIKKHI